MSFNLTKEKNLLKHLTHCEDTTIRSSVFSDISCHIDYDSGESMLIINQINSGKETFEYFELKIDQEGKPLFTKEYFDKAFEIKHFLGKPYISSKTNNMPFQFYVLLNHIIGCMNEFIQQTFFDFLNNTNDTRLSEEGSIRFLKYLLFEPTSLEKMIKTGGANIAITHLNVEESFIEDKGKFNKTFGLSPELFEKISNLELESATSKLREIGSIDRNYPEMVLNFIDSYKKFINLTKPKYFGRYHLSKYDTIKFIDKLIYLLNKGYQLKQLLGYIFKQSLLYEGNTFQEIKNNDRFLFFPTDTIITLSDYVNMMCEMKLSYEKYPIYLKKAHTMCLNNYNAFSGVKEEDFQTVVKDWDHLEVSNKEFLIRRPHQKLDLVVEGNNLHHCVGSYAKNIVKEGTIVCFLRKKESPDESFVTLELIYDKQLSKYFIIQAKQAFDETVEPELYKKIEKLVSTIKTIDKENLL